MNNWAGEFDALHLVYFLRSNIINDKNAVLNFQDIVFFKGGAGCLQVNSV